MEIQILLKVYVINTQICNWGYALPLKVWGQQIIIIFLNTCMLLFKKDALNWQHIFQNIFILNKCFLTFLFIKES